MAARRNRLGFNPRPADWPGDARFFRSLRSERNCFNPRPADWPGDALWRATLLGDDKCFNPRPADWPGYAKASSALQGAQRVSIRARPIGRAMLNAALANPEGKAFQSAPGRLAGRCPWPGWQSPTWTSFNPRPADWPGDALGRRPASSFGLGFNPRPADWPGDARIGGRLAAHQIVSIRARPIGRAMRGATLSPAAGEDEFQSAPGRLAGRCR